MEALVLDEDFGRHQDLFHNVFQVLAVRSLRLQQLLDNKLLLSIALEDLRVVLANHVASIVSLNAEGSFTLPISLLLASSLHIGCII